MKSLENLASVRVAILICNHSEFKVLIQQQLEVHQLTFSEDVYSEIQKNSVIILNSLNMPTCLHLHVYSSILPMFNRIANWIYYYEKKTGLSPKFCLTILNYSMFTQEGIINTEEVLQSLIRLNILQISSSTECSENVNDNELLLWRYFMDQNVEHLPDNQHMWDSAVSRFINEGNEAAVKFCWRKLDDNHKERIIVDSAVNVVRTVDENYYFSANRNYSHIDLLHFLIGKMSEPQQQQFFRGIAFYLKTVLYDYLLLWPYHHQFLSMAHNTMTWGILPGDAYVLLITEIARNRNDIVNNNPDLLKELWLKSPDTYKRYAFSDLELRLYPFELNAAKVLTNTLFKPELYDRKMIELLLQDGTPSEKRHIIAKHGIEIFKNILRNVESGNLYADRIFEVFDDVVRLFGAVENEITGIKSTLVNACTSELKTLIQKEHYKSADGLLKWCLHSNAEIEIIKEELAYRGNVFYTMILKENWLQMERFSSWCFTDSAKKDAFKKYLASNDFCSICYGLLCVGKWEQVDAFLIWVFSSERSICEFKKDKLLPVLGANIHCQLVRENKWDQVEKLISWLELSASEVMKLKKETTEFMFFVFENLVKRPTEERYIISSEHAPPDALLVLFRWLLFDIDAAVKFQESLKLRYKYLSGHQRDNFKQIELSVERRLYEIKTYQ